MKKDAELDRREAEEDAELWQLHEPWPDCELELWRDWHEVILDSCGLLDEEEDQE